MLPSPRSSVWEISLEGSLGSHQRGPLHSGCATSSLLTPLPVLLPLFSAVHFGGGVHANGSLHLGSLAAGFWLGSAHAGAWQETRRPAEGGQGTSSFLPGSGDGCVPPGLQLSRCCRNAISPANPSNSGGHSFALLLISEFPNIPS